MDQERRIDANGRHQGERMLDKMPADPFTETVTDQAVWFAIRYLDPESDNRDCRFATFITFTAIVSIVCIVWLLFPPSRAMRLSGG
jgi:hypothetical protein